MPSKYRQAEAEKLLKAAKEVLEEDTVSSDDFATLAGLLTDYVLAIKESSDALLANVERDIRAKLDSLQNGKDGAPGVPGRNGSDGRDADPEEVAEIVLKRVPKLPEIKDHTQDIEELQERLDKIEDILKGAKTRIGGMFGGTTVVTQRNDMVILTPAETPDSAEDTFNFGQKPRLVVVNGATYREGNGWTFTSGACVLDFAPATGSDVYAIL